MCKVSVIVAIYNAEPYLRQCLDSLLAQTLKDFELILVDDGSPDNCGSICDEYAKRDNRIKVIHQPNGGVSKARQAGLNAATGEYIIHADPDDWVESTMLADLFSFAVHNGADVVICDYYTDRREGADYISQDPGNDLNGYAIAERIINQKQHGGLCNKLVRRVCCKSLTFCPDHLCMWEDALWCSRLFLKNVRAKYMPKAYYHYRINNKASVCNSFSHQVLHAKMDVVAEIESWEHVPFISTYAMKKNILFDCWAAGHFNVLKTLYPEIHERIILDGRQYCWLSPVSSCLSLALRGYPRAAKVIYKINIGLICQLKRIKRCIFKHAE